ncbi:aldehyde dehydrogenase family protein [Streptomyces echinatus]|uniref:aldehyde dehydrogenase family protein n=1 Tax=Streptomyces echinatus TaxID=67293 RepID=UPI0037ADBD22
MGRPALNWPGSLVSFTGSRRAGQQVAAGCAQLPKPVTLEPGGGSTAVDSGAAFAQSSVPPAGCHQYGPTGDHVPECR